MAVSRFATNVTTFPEDTNIPPAVNPAGFATSPLSGMNTEVKQQVFGAEFICSLVFYIAWLVIRKTKMTMGEGLSDQHVNLIKPIFVFLAY